MIMKKRYLKPVSEIVCLGDEIMAPNMNSVKMDTVLPGGDKVTPGEDTGADDDFGGDAKKFNLWDDWD